MKRLFLPGVIFIFCFAIKAQDFKTVQNGIEYAQFTRPIVVSGKEDAQTTINALRLDLTKVRLDVVHALDAAIGVETTSSMATRHGAIAAINAGFFRLDKSIFNGDPAGVLQIDGKLWSESYANRTALFISNNPDQTKIDVGQINLSNKLKISAGESFVAMELGTNRERKSDDAVLYNPNFHRTTLNNLNGVEIIVENSIVKSIVKNNGSHLIPDEGFIISASGENIPKVLNVAKVGATINVFTAQTGIVEGNSVKFSDYFKKAEDIIGGVPQLIKNGKIEITWEREKSSKSFVETRHPRTAVAKLAGGKFLMVTIDGRSETSGGMSLPELAAMLLEMGATDAMNLDGGGSTTMFLNGKIVNQPSDKDGERLISDAILVTLRK